MLAVLVAMLRRLRAVELRLQALQLHYFTGCCGRLGARLRADKQVYVLPCHRPRSIGVALEASSGGLLKPQSTLELGGLHGEQNPRSAS